MPFGIPLESGQPITIQDEGITLTNNVGNIDLTGAGVSASATGDNVTITITGATGSGTPRDNVSFLGSDGTPSGGSTVFTLPSTPIAGSEHVFLNQGRQREVITNYTLSSNQLTFPFLFDPTWEVVIDYRE